MNIPRQLGKLTVKGAGNDAKVQVLLNDFEQADKTLEKIISAVKAWRDAWVSILNIQSGIVTSFEELYNPIVGAGEGHTTDAVATSQEKLQRSSKLKQAYQELKIDLLEEVNMMDARIVRPASDCREHIKPIKKVIKKRDDKRLDFERYQDRVQSIQKKTKKADNDEVKLARAQEDLARAQDLFEVADEHLRNTLPGITAAAFSLLPHLLAAQIMTQNNLLAQYYTVLHNYCTEENFPSPPPPMEDVVLQWGLDFKPIQGEVESINTIARGKAVHQPMQLGDDKKSLTGLNLRGNLASRRRSSHGAVAPGPGPVSPNPNGRVMRIPSNTSVPSPPDEQEEPDTRSGSGYLAPGITANFASRAPSGPRGDYFQQAERTASSTSLVSNGSRNGNGNGAGGMLATPSMGTRTPSTSSLSLASSIAGKKKPPPPPPKPKRIGSTNGIYATAIWDFNGQEQGDLSFAEGDSIKIIKKTESTDDWWEGELRGVRGKFPANYCEIK